MEATIVHVRAIGAGISRLALLAGAVFAVCPAQGSDRPDAWRDDAPAKRYWVGRDGAEIPLQLDQWVREVIADFALNAMPRAFKGETKEGLIVNVHGNATKKDFGLPQVRMLWDLQSESGRAIIWVHSD